MQKVLRSVNRAAYPVAFAVALVLSAAAFTSDAQATGNDAGEQTVYKFRLVNKHVNKTPYIRCGSSGDWTRVGRGWSRDVTCSGALAQTKIGNGAAIDHTHNCSPQPVMRIEYSGYYIGLRLRESLIVGCRPS